MCENTSHWLTAKGDEYLNLEDFAQRHASTKVTNTCGKSGNLKYESLASMLREVACQKLRRDAAFMQRIEIESLMADIVQNSWREC